MKTPTSTLTNASDGLRRLSDRLKRFAELTGQCTAWLLVIMVALQTVIVILRYGFGYGSIAMQELVTYLHACCFMLGAAYTLQADDHVRVDIFYRRLSDRRRAMVNLLGNLLFLAPLCLLVLFGSFDYVALSWQIRESSSDPGGIAAVYLLKSLIPAFALLLLVQCVASIISNLLLIGRDKDLLGEQR